jgi:hypothetical protein
VSAAPLAVAAALMPLQWVQNGHAREKYFLRNLRARQQKNDNAGNLRQWPMNAIQFMQKSA